MQDTFDNRPNRQQRLLRPSVIAAALATLFAPTAWADNSVDLGNDTTFSYTFTANYGVAMRTGKQSETLLSPQNINGDDGDRNFHRGSLITNRASLLGEGNLQHGDFGLFVRGSAFYDTAYQGTNANNAPGTVNHSGAFNEFTSYARDFQGQRAQLLDAYAYGAVGIGETRLSGKIGNQVVAWGESLFFPNIAGAQGPVDATKSFVPGAEVKDILLPVPQASLQWQINPSFSLMGYYQFVYKENQLFPPGSFFSTSDIVGPGSQYLIAGPGFNIPRGPDIKPTNDGQWGIGTRFRVAEDTEIGLYQLRYSDKNPSVVISMFPTMQYQQKYFGGINLTGASFSTQMFGANVAGEVSYKDGQPMLVNVQGSPTATRGKVVQGQLSAIYSIGPNKLANSQSLVAEVGYIHVLSVDPVYGQTVLTNSRDAFAAQIGWSLTYNNVLDGWDMTIPLTYAQAISGHTSVPGAFGSLYGAGDRRASIGVTMKYLNNLELNLTYAKFMGGADLNDRPLADRSYVAFNAKYSF
ncbi:hypothetical protein PI87_21780 [Ralstonia sp. A12]|uniref:DUF1302 domain-containing protein n=1 Tax=Ralstonia sp. A12 TaxID=1217052 RepID=UPI0005745FF6|nr:DUF1302 family protein [Ralstonia sp. A12]KHK51154.1 hypothetical protein PI87_21780 [Ralstonia sp. A12]